MVVAPVGFVSDHVEVIWDLDTEARERAEELGIAFARASTPDADRRFAKLAVDLIDELRYGREPERLPSRDAPPLQGFSVNGAPCTPDCGWLRGGKLR